MRESKFGYFPAGFSTDVIKVRSEDCINYAFTEQLKKVATTHKYTYEPFTHAAREHKPDHVLMMPNASAVILETMRWRSADESERNMSNSIRCFLNNKYRTRVPFIKGIIVNIVHGVAVQQIIDETGKTVKTLLTKITGKFPTGLSPIVLQLLKCKELIET